MDFVGIGLPQVALVLLVAMLVLGPSRIGRAIDGLIDAIEDRLHR